MNQNDWLVNEGNQTALYQISEQVISQLAPDELPLLEELLPLYVEARIEYGDVNLNASPEQAFAFDGWGDIVSSIILEIVAGSIQAAFVACGIYLFHVLRTRWRPNNSPTPSRFADLTQEALEIIVGNVVDATYDGDSTHRARVIRIVLDAIIRTLENQDDNESFFDSSTPD